MPDQTPKTDSSQGSSANYFIYLGEKLITLVSLYFVFDFIRKTVGLYRNAAVQEFALACFLLLAAGGVHLYLWVIRPAADQYKSCKKIVLEQTLHDGEAERERALEELRQDSERGKKRSALRYILFFISGMLCVVSVTGCVLGCGDLRSGNSGPALLIGGIAATLAIIAATIFLYVKIKNAVFPVSPRAADDCPEERVGDASVCGHCGVELPDGASVCPICGEKAK